MPEGTTAVLCVGSGADTGPQSCVFDRRRERKFRNRARQRGGRVRTAEEMCGTEDRAKAMDRCNFAKASTNAEMYAAGAARVRQWCPDGAFSVARHVFAANPGRVLCLHHGGAATPPCLGAMNPYGGEGPALRCGTASNSARRNAATTPPA